MDKALFLYPLPAGLEENVPDSSFPHGQPGDAFCPETRPVLSPRLL